MRALLLTAATLALAACGPALPPQEATREAEAAAARGDAWHALGLYRDAAMQGDLDALKTVADTYERGYVRAASGSGAYHLPILTLPGQGRRWRARYEHLRDARARSGDPASLLRVAEDLTVWNPQDTAADRDSARAIRQRLVKTDYGPALLLEALSIRDAPLERDRLLRRAEAAGNAQACYLRVMLEHSMQITAAQIAGFLDDVEACPPLPSDHPRASDQIVRNLVDAQRRGETDATAHIDSLRALGVFERHPRLAEIVASES